MSTAQSDLLVAALDVFRTQGYAATTLEQVAQEARLDVGAVRAQYADKGSLFAALLANYSPLHDLEAALDGVQGDTADDIVRDAMRRIIRAIQDNKRFMELAALDVQANNGAFLASLSTKLFPRATAFLERLKATGQLRPVSDVILSRTLVALLMGFILSEQAMPQVARVAMRMFPQRAWIDGMVDLMLYGILEDDAR
jgi:AcrR family transcriptional regulator